MTRNNHIAGLSEDPALTEAASWFDRLQHDELSADDFAAWQRWIAESPAHKLAFDRLQDLWQRLEDVVQPAPASKARRAVDEYDGDESVAEWNTTIETRSAPRRERRFDISALVRPFAAAAMLAIVLLAGAGAWQLWNRSSAPTVAVFETQAAQHREVQLADGSTLELGAKSLVWVRFSAAQRDVVLDRGEAFFQVAKDATRPFVVRAGDTRITAIGTAFNVRKSSDRVRVAVQEGVVSVRSQAAAEGVLDADVAPTESGSAPLQGRHVTAGHEVLVQASSAMTTVSTTPADAATSWRTGRLEYINEPLKYVVADVNRYSRAEIVVADPALGELLVTGTVFEDDIDGWLHGIGAFIPVRVERDASNRVVLYANQNE